MKLPVAILALTLAFGTPADLFAQKVKSPQDNPKQKEIRDQKEKEKAQKEAKEANVASKQAQKDAVKQGKEAEKEAMEASRQLKEDAREAKKEGLETTGENPAQSEEARLLEEKERAMMKRVSQEKYGIDEAKYEKYTHMTNDELEGLAAERKLEAKRARTAEQIARLEAQYYDNKIKLKSAMERAESQHKAGKMSDEEYAEKKAKIDRATQAMRGMREKIDSLKASLGAN